MFSSTIFINDIAYTSTNNVSEITMFCQLWYADMFTKPLPNEKFEEHRDKVMSGFHGNHPIIDQKIISTLNVIDIEYYIDWSITLENEILWSYAFPYWGF